ncbi:hypothetical protein BDD12DRAFT_420770 [Trichophaea hybrida]|nr:hypothetical protein BDD12DRAFT_420770 [Trichophaea hybrida]
MCYTYFPGLRLPRRFSSSALSWRERRGLLDRIRSLHAYASIRYHPLVFTKFTITLNLILCLFQFTLGTNPVMNNKRNSGSDTNPPSTFSSSDNSKKLRQTTLPWAPKPHPRSSDSTVSPYFPSSRPPLVREVSTPTRPGRGRGQGRGRGAGEGSGAGSGISRGSPSSTPSSTLSRENSDISRQYFFPVPSWSRPIRKINMASTKVRHLPVMQRIACEQLIESPRVIAASGATANSTLYVEQRGVTSPYALTQSIALVFQAVRS